MWLIFLWLAASLTIYPVASAEEGKEQIEKVIYSTGQADDGWMDMGTFYSASGTIDVTGPAVFPGAIYGRGSSTNVHTINLHFNLDAATDLVLLLGIFSESGGDSALSTEELKVFLNGELLQAIDLLPEGSVTKEPKKQKVIMVPAETGANVLTLDMNHNLNLYNCWFDYVLLYQPRNP